MIKLNQQKYELKAKREELYAEMSEDILRYATDIKGWRTLIKKGQEDKESVSIIMFYEDMCARSVDSLNFELQHTFRKLQDANTEVRRTLVYETLGSIDEHLEEAIQDGFDEIKNIWYNDPK